ncbi:hypothetical protein THAOC_24083, partial [Thalassiosira oceanica]
GPRSGCREEARRQLSARRCGSRDPSERSANPCRTGGERQGPGDRPGQGQQEEWDRPRVEPGGPAGMRPPRKADVKGEPGLLIEGRAGQLVGWPKISVLCVACQRCRTACAAAKSLTLFWRVRLHDQRIAMENFIRKIERIEANTPVVDTLAIGLGEDYVPERYLKGWEYDQEDDDYEYELLSIQDESIDWKRVCTAIQRSKVLKELHLSGIRVVPNGNDSNFRESDLRALMVAFANSKRQLTKLSLNTLCVPFEILLSENCPDALRKSGLRLKIEDCEVTTGDVDVLIGHISRGDNLVAFEFANEFDHDADEDRLEFDEVIKHLINHCQLESLSLVNAGLTPTGISAIASMLQKPDTKLVGLELESNGIGVDEFKTIVESLSTNRTLQGLSYNNFNGAAIESTQLIDRLLSLKDLRLRMLSTSCERIADPEAAMLSKRFNSYGNLTYLQLELGASLTMSGWNALGDYIQSSRCILDQLNLPNSNLDDAKLQSLSTWISSHGTIKYLHLHENRAITVDGWRVFFHLVLENPKSKLNVLDISDCGIEDETIRLFANAIRRNCTLRHIDVGSSDEGESDVTKEGWDFITNVLCSKTSIMETYLSNHTLDEIKSSEPLPEDLQRWLDFNCAFTTSQAARWKIVITHFPESGMRIGAICPFLEMDIKLLPHAMNWVGKGDELVQECLTSTIMYELVRHLGLFVEHGADYSDYSMMRSPVKKRQRITK